MTALEFNAELFRQLSLIADDKAMMEKVLRYLKKLTAQKKPTRRR